MFLFSAGGFGRESGVKLEGLTQVLRAAFIPWISSETENRRVSAAHCNIALPADTFMYIYRANPRAEGSELPSFGGTCPFVNFRRSAVVLASALC